MDPKGNLTTPLWRGGEQAQKYDSFDGSVFDNMYFGKVKFGNVIVVCVCVMLYIFMLSIFMRLRVTLCISEHI